MLAVGGVMIGRNGQEPEKVPIPVRGSAAGLRDAQRVDSRDTGGRGYAGNLFPFQPMIAVDLRPGHPPQFVQRLQGGVALRLGQVEQVFLKDRIIQIEPDHASGLRLGHAPGPALLPGCRRPVHWLAPRPGPC